MLSLNSVELGSSIWPSSLFLSHFLHTNQEWRRRYIDGRNVLELGCGVGVCGVHLALGGWCNRVYMTDGSSALVEAATRVARTNGVLDPNKLIPMQLKWGEFPESLIKLRGDIDLVIGADVLYERPMFERVFATVPFLGVPFLTAYQHRGEGLKWFRLLCRKWHMKMERITWEFDPDLLRHEVNVTRESNVNHSNAQSHKRNAASTTPSSEISTRNEDADMATATTIVEPPPMHANVSLELLLFTPSKAAGSTKPWQCQHPIPPNIDNS